MKQLVFWRKILEGIIFRQQITIEMEFPKLYASMYLAFIIVFSCVVLFKPYNPTIFQII